MLIQNTLLKHHNFCEILKRSNFSRMRASTYARTVRPKESKTEKSMMTVIREAVTNQVKQRDINLTKQIKDLQKAQRVQDDDIKRVKKQAYQIAVREYDIKELEKDVSEFKQLMRDSHKVQLETTNVLKHIKEMKRQTHQFNQLPTTPHVSMEFSQLSKSSASKMGMSSATMSESEFEYDTSDLDEEAPSQKIETDFKIPANHEPSEQIKRVKAFVEKLKQEVTHHEKIVVSYENLAREKRVRIAIQMKIRLSLDKRQINAEFQRNCLDSQFNAEISQYKNLLSQKNQLVKRLNLALDKQSELDVNEYDIKLQEEYNKNLGSEKYHLKKSDDQTFEVQKFVKSDNLQYINDFENRVTEDLEELLKEQSILEENLKVATADLENTKSNIEANNAHIDDILSRISQRVQQSSIDFEKVSSDLTNQINLTKNTTAKRTETATNDLGSSSQALNDLKTKIEDIHKERIQIAEKEYQARYFYHEEILKADAYRNNMVELKERKENALIQLNILKIRENVAIEILDLFMNEYDD